MTSPLGAMAALDLNIYNLIFITVGLLLHWRPKRFLGRHTVHPGHGRRADPISIFMPSSSA